MLYHERFLYVGTPGHYDPALDGGSARVVHRLSRFDQILRVAYAFSPTFTLQLFSQWLVTK